MEFVHVGSPPAPKLCPPAKEIALLLTESYARNAHTQMLMKDSTRRLAGANSFPKCGTGTPHVRRDNRREHSDIGKALTREEEKKLLSTCVSNALLNAVVTVALNTALRKNEIRTLRWSQIDFEKRTVTVGRAKTHAGTGRVIPLNQPALKALIKWAGRLVESKAEDYVFPACEAAGIERETPTPDALTLPVLSRRGARHGARPSSGRATCNCAFTICGTPALPSLRSHRLANRR